MTLLGETTYRLHLRTELRGIRQQHVLLGPDLVDLVRQLTTELGFDGHVAARIVSTAMGGN
jgi:hypothetical protein